MPDTDVPARAGETTPATSAVTLDDIRRSEAAIQELRQARRGNHREKVHWIDTLYKAYITALGSIGAIVIGSTWFPNERLDADAAQRFFAEGPRWLGLVAAVAFAIGLRTGSRGGPLAVEGPAIQYELLAPVPTSIALRAPVVRHLRFAAFAGAVTGGVVGTLVSHRLTQSAVAIVLCCMASFALVSVGANAVAIAVCGRRIGKIPANLAALALLAWSAADLAAGASTSPLTGLAAVAFLPLGFTPVVVAGIVVVPVAVVLAFTGLERLSLERARERAGLVAQLRFAATLQDVRTVVLLRRQLSQERPRSRPWIRLGRGGGRTVSRIAPTWRRDWQSYLRFPLTRVLRMVVLAVIAGLAMGFTWRGAYPAFVIAGLALFVAAYDAVEPIAQEVDHPTRWHALRGDEGRLLLSHLVASLVLMMILVAIAGATSLLLVPSSVVASLLPPAFVLISGAAVVGAALSTTMGNATQGSGLSGMPSGSDGMGMDVMGAVMVIRMVLPPALVIGAIAPMMAAGIDASALDTKRVSNLSTWPFIVVFLALLFLRYRKPSRI